MIPDSTRTAAWRTAALTAVSMLAFAANSVLCRMALEPPSAIDPTSFGSIRLVAGAIVLAFLARSRAGRSRAARPDWTAAVMLFAYVACFSFAYRLLTAGTGALILFGAVQLTMFGAGLHAGERFGALAWSGFGLAVIGMVYLASPGVAAPAPGGAALMAAAGIGWGVYSLRGRHAVDPLQSTAANFLRAAPLALVLSLGFAGDFHCTLRGATLALVSGAVTSGLGYVVWYAALRGLTAMRAAAVQLSVPPVAAFGGVLLLSEAVTLHLVAASVAVLGGVALVLLGRSRVAARPAARSQI